MKDKTYIITKNDYVLAEHTDVHSSIWWSTLLAADGNGLINLSLLQFQTKNITKEYIRSKKGDPNLYRYEIIELNKFILNQKLKKL